MRDQISRAADRENLTPFRCSVHTHTTLCDGKGTPEEMAESAYRMGVRYYGFSGHSHCRNPADEGYTLPTDTADYCRKVLELRARYAGRMEILLGIEWDSRADGPQSADGVPKPGDGQNADRIPERFDYWIGSVHSLTDGTGHYYAVDSRIDTFLTCRERVFGGDVFAMAEAYYAEVARTAARKPTILGHIDLITKYNEGNALFDGDAPRYRNAALDALHAADPSRTLLEINTGAISRGYRKTPYPAPFLLREWRSMGGRVILTADTHHPDTILYAYDLAVEWAKDAGFRTCVILTLQGMRECPLTEAEAVLPGADGGPVRRRQYPLALSPVQSSDG